MSESPRFISNGKYQTSLLIIITTIVSASLLIQLFYVQPYIKNKEIEHSKEEQQMDTINLYSMLNTKMNKALNELSTTANLHEFKTMNLPTQNEHLNNLRTLTP